MIFQEGVEASGWVGVGAPGTAPLGSRPELRAAQACPWPSPRCDPPSEQRRLLAFLDTQVVDRKATRFVDGLIAGRFPNMPEVS